ncbi:MAG: hypothetical protein EZS28_043606, partial [Streblomastix strix]
MEEKEGENKIVKRGGNVYEKITPLLSVQMSEMVNKDCTITAKQIQAKIAEDYDTNLSISQLNLYLREGLERHNMSRITIKKLRVHENARDSLETLDDRVQYVSDYLKLKLTGAEFVFIDESSFQQLELRNQGRSPIGTPAITHRNRREITNISAITAICQTFGILHVTFVVGSNDSDTIVLFLDSLFIEMKDKGIVQIVLVMDNAPVHLTELVKDKIKKSNHILLNSAKWSCELNPIEYIFGIWKKRVVIPPSESNPRQVINHLNTAFSKISTLEVRRCINMVELLLFPLALKRQTIKLNTGMQHIQQYLRNYIENNISQKSNVVISLNDLDFDEAESYDENNETEEFNDAQQLEKDKNTQKKNNEDTQIIEHQIDLEHIENEMEFLKDNYDELEGNIDNLDKKELKLQYPSHQILQQMSHAGFQMSDRSLQQLI